MAKYSRAGLIKNSGAKKKEGVTIKCRGIPTDYYAFGIINVDGIERRCVVNSSLISIESKARRIKKKPKSIIFTAIKIYKKC